MLFLKNGLYYIFIPSNISFILLHKTAGPESILNFLVELLGKKAGK